jgi:hypothetical protein
MTYIDDLTLQDCRLEDVETVLPKIEKSFGLKFGCAEFKNVKTFGDLCKIVENHVNYHDIDCTLQQGFYKARNSISRAQNIDKHTIKTDSRLEELFPRKTRIKDWKRVEDELEFKVPILTMQNGLFWILFSGFLLTFLCFFLSWKIALISLTGFWILSKFLDRFSKELSLQNVGELSRKITSENYTLIRRNGGSGNAKEVFDMIQEMFSSELEIHRDFLTRDALLPLK